MGAPGISTGVVATSVAYELPYRYRSSQHDSDLDRIARAAAGLIEPGAVVVVGQERAVRATAVIRPALHRAAARRGAEHTRPAREQPGEVGRNQVLRISRVVELHPLAGEVQFHFSGVRCAHKS